MILLENALEAWASAIFYCDKIMAGKATLENKKHFIASLQNSVELFVKQYMINVNDYRVATVKQYDANGEPIKSYLASKDLNKYFNSISGSDTIKSFYTIEFNKIIDLQKELFKSFFSQENASITKALITLQKLRNNETRFFIADVDFMTDQEFQELHNFMVVFYKLLKYYQLLPFLGDPSGKYEKLTFEKSLLNQFSYKKQLKNSKFVQELKTIIEKVYFSGADGEESYNIAEEIVNYCDEYSNEDFYEIWEYVSMLEKYDLIQIIEDQDFIIIKGEHVFMCYRLYKIQV